MLVYVIDGFNVIHRIQALKTSPVPCEDFIAFIKQKGLTGSRNNKVVVVFDGTSRLAQNPGGYEAVFSGPQSADEVIIKRVERLGKKAQRVVVTDDRELQALARRAGARCMSVDEFLKKGKKKRQTAGSREKISYSLQREITEEMRKIWLKE